jgi:hypothetical protein
MKTTAEKLEIIANKFNAISYNQNNYGVGGGLSEGKFASNRHEDAKIDSGKLTLGQAKQLLKKATDLDLELIDSVIKYAVPNMEWHHAGKLPKQYGGGMKKTYFLNSTEIADLATNWNSHFEKLQISLQTQKNAEILKRNIEEVKLSFLQENAVKKVRTESKGLFFYETDREMDGKYGWFSSYGKSYNMTEYYTGWQFSNEEKYMDFLNIK